MKSLLYFILSSSLFAGQLTPLQKELPTPFSYFENLYFDSKTSSFFGIKDIPQKAIDLNTKRGFCFKNKKPIKNAKTIHGTTLLLFEAMETRNYLSHFFHLLEHIVGFWSFYPDSEKVRLIVLAADGELKSIPWKGSNEINRHLLKALFPNAKVATWKQFLKSCKEEVVCFEKALTSDRALSFLSPDCASLNKMLGYARNFLSKDSLKSFKEKVHSYANGKKTTPFSITYLKRHPPRALDPDLEKRLLADLKTLGNLQIADFANIPFSDQIKTIANTDVLISVHGNGLSHLLFLPDGAKVIEIFPPDSHSLDYRLFADARGLKYTGIIANRGIVPKEEAYKKGAFGNINTPISNLNLSLILSEASR